MREKILTQSLVLSFVLFLSLTFIQCGSKDKEVEKALVTVVDAINKQCPITVDQITRLDKCEAKGKELTYYYTITDTSMFDAKQFEEIGVPTIKEALKSNPQVALFREYNVVIKYKYSDKDGKELYNLTVNPSDYK